MAIFWRITHILVFAHFVVSQKHNQCGEPTKYEGRQLDKRYLNRSQFSNNEKVAYNCYPGYAQTYGSRITFCKDGHWTPLTMICKKKTCSPLADIENGQYLQEGQSFLDKATAVCNAGYVLRGDKVRVCEDKGWTGMSPTCEVSVVTCSAPAVANGGIYYGSRTSYKPEDTVTITCKEGFDLIGSTQVICGPDGQWQALPECRLKEISDTSKCGPPQSTDLAHPREEYYGKEFKSGDRVRYKCTVGHRWSAGQASIYCKDGRWTELQIQCERKKCGSAGEISYGRFEYTGVSFGDSAKAVCQEGYELIGPAVRYCLDGGWNGRIPVCEPVHCPPPPVVKDADMFDPTYDYVPFGYALSYRCRTGALIGERDIHCTQNGTWSAPPPKCKDVFCPVPKVPNGSRMMGFRSVYRFGNTVMFTCSPGYKLKGENYIACGQDGEWKPNLPQCVNTGRHHFKRHSHRVSTNM
ncbi:complement receptor type 2 isoform X2 [Myxocyprinus asiaticus]|uniref:complement receptor type 2 isoform X2 n=1 Tax=Myxocyprinus asiaticus TaxID=70543 RepID=UPI0022227795|nr:complement receptor type 2 isoform X2 [Myxocyprinus asiaticus]